ncbi:MAG TPA: patatin-like phospholipase family protein [Anaerolineales bacterium]
MKPFRKNLAIAIDGGGIRGVIVTRALTMLEEALGSPIHNLARLYAGTSTGSIISAGLAVGLSAARIHELYLALGDAVFRKTLRSRLFPLSRYRYSPVAFEAALHAQLGDVKLKDLWDGLHLTDLVLTSFDVLKNKTLFIKPWKLQYQDWLLRDAVLASSCVPTYFPPVDGRYLDGGVGSYANPCYLAAYELSFCLGWDPEETTLISLGTGRSPALLKPGQPSRIPAWDWLDPVLDAFLSSANDQQVRLVKSFFKKLDFRRFQVDLQDNPEMDDTSRIPELLEYGTRMGNMILNDELDSALRIRSTTPREEGSKSIPT